MMKREKEWGEGNERLIETKKKYAFFLRLKGNHLKLME